MDIISILGSVIDFSDKHAGTAGIIISVIMGFKALRVANKQLKLASLQEQRHIDSQKTNVECIFEPLQEELLRKMQVGLGNIRVINHSLHPIFIKNIIGEGFNYTVNQNIRTGNWILHVRIEPQGEASYKDTFDPRRTVKINIQLTSGEEREVKLPMWWGKQDET